MEPPALAALRTLRLFRASGVDRWFGCCPVTEENTPSLRIVLRDGKLLLHCFGCGAGARQVLEILRLPWSSLWEGGKAPTKQARQAQQGLYSWRDTELDRLGRRIDARYSVIERFHGLPVGAATTLDGAMLLHCYRGLSALEYCYESLLGARGKDAILALYRTVRPCLRHSEELNQC